MRSKVSRAVIAVSGLAFLIIWFFDPFYSESEVTQQMIESLVSHLLGCVVFVALLFLLRYRVFKRPFVSSLAVVLPSLAVAVNNAPIIALATGNAQIEHWELLPLFAIDCLLIATFEELAFRGTLFLILLEKHRSSSKQIFWTTVVSSVIFGLVHFANLLEGAGIIPTVMQVGYSCLIGGMCAIVLLKTGNILFSILIHAIYNFGGRLLQMIGSGYQWDTVTVVLTAVLAVAVGIWMLIVLFCISPAEANKFYSVKEGKRIHEHAENQ